MSFESLVRSMDMNSKGLHDIVVGKSNERLEETDENRRENNKQSSEEE